MWPVTKIYQLIHLLGTLLIAQQPNENTLTRATRTQAYLRPDIDCMFTVSVLGRLLTNIS